MGVAAVGFGLLTCQQHPEDPRAPGVLFHDAVDLAVEAEKLGYDSVWTSEHHFFDDGYLSSQMPLLAAIASRTSRIALGPCVVLLPLYDPVHLAEDVASVDLLADGRLVFGAGLGWRDEELEAFGVGQADRARRLVAGLNTLRDAWSGRPVVAGAGAARVCVTPLPSQRGGPPVWLAAMVPAAARRAGRLADGFVATKVGPAELGRLEAAAQEGMDSAGRSETAFTVALHHPVFAWRGRDAWQRVAPYLHYMEWKYDDMTGVRGRAPGSGRPPAVDQARDAYLRDASIWGSPQRVADGILAYAGAVERDIHFIARSCFPGMDPGVQRETMRVFADDVIPLLRSGAIGT